MKSRDDPVWNTKSNGAWPPVVGLVDRAAYLQMVTEAAAFMEGREKSLLSRSAFTG